MSLQERTVKLLSDFLRIAAAAGLVVSVVLVAFGQFWIPALGGITPFSLGGISGLYLIMNRRLKKDGATQGQSIVLAILYANVFAQTFEVVYHFTFPVYFYYFKPPFLGADEIRYIVFEGVMILPIFLLRTHLRFGLLSKVLLLSFAAVWAIWILFGFPQYFTSVLYYPQILASSDLYHVSLLLNFGSKSLLALFFWSLARRRIR